MAYHGADVMSRFRSTAILTGVGLALALSGCGEVASTVPRPSVSWYPSTPAPTPGPAKPSASAPAAAAPPQVGQAAQSGLGTPAANFSATDQLAFDPTTLTAKKGGVVQWKNTGTVSHNVTFDAQPSLSSGTLAAGDTWQVQFTTAGTYKFHCTFHPGMNGQITVGG
jgi:plastocyanin